MYKRTVGELTAVAAGGGCCSCCSGAATSMRSGRIDLPSIPGARSNPANDKNVGVRSTLLARKLWLAPGVMPGPFTTR